MKFRNYCIVVMGETEGVLPEISKISETMPSVLDGGGVVIATFSSIADPKELTEYFKSNNRNFLIFDLNPENSGYNMNKEKINEGLFGFLSSMNEQTLREKTDNLIKEISSTTVNTVLNTKNSNRPTSRVKQPQISVDDIDKMSPKAKNDLMNKLIDKGVNNLSEQDKKILNKLAI